MKGSGVRPHVMTVSPSESSREKTREGCRSGLVPSTCYRSIPYSNSQSSGPACHHRVVSWLFDSIAPEGCSWVAYAVTWLVSSHKVRGHTADEAAQAALLVRRAAGRAAVVALLRMRLRLLRGLARRREQV